MEEKFYAAIDKTFDALVKNDVYFFSFDREYFEKKRKYFGEYITKLYVHNTVTINREGIFELSNYFNKYFLSIVNDEEKLIELTTNTYIRVEEEYSKRTIVMMLLRYYIADFAEKITGGVLHIDFDEIDRLGTVAGDIWQLNGKPFELAK